MLIFRVPLTDEKREEVKKAIYANMDKLEDGEEFFIINKDKAEGVKGSKEGNKIFVDAVVPII